MWCHLSQHEQKTTSCKQRSLRHSGLITLPRFEIPRDPSFRFIQTRSKMCHQLIQIFECGHNTGSKIVKCKKPTSECNEIFLRQELEDTPRPCAVCLPPRFIQVFTNLQVMSEESGRPESSPGAKGCGRG